MGGLVLLNMMIDCGKGEFFGFECVEIIKKS